MFLAGFPDTYRRGSLAHVKEGGDEIKKVVVVQYAPEQSSVSTINLKNRKKLTVKDHTMEPVIFWHQCRDSARLPLLLGIMQKMFVANKGMQRFCTLRGFSKESCHYLFLAIEPNKHFLFCLKS